MLDNIQEGAARAEPADFDQLETATSVCDVNLDIEMETGTGKTYCYIKTMFEMNKRYGWSKFIVVVPSIAIREGVYKSFEITAEHFLETYGKKARFFIYNSKQLHELESFSSDAGHQRDGHQHPGVQCRAARTPAVSMRSWTISSRAGPST